MSELISPVINELETVSTRENDQLAEEVVKEDTSSSETSSESESQENKNEPPAKRRRKRKRKPKKKKALITTTAYVPEEPFQARYENLPAFLNSAVPKVHLRFDTEGNEDENKSQFNYKPRLIKALLINLSLCENFNQVEKEIEMEVTQEIPELADEVVSKKPRIIKAIECSLFK